MTQDANVPLYRRIKAEIMERIVAGDLKPGEPLPTRSDLAVHYHTTKVTIDRAMQELAREGMITAGSGRRTLILPPGKPIARSIAVVWSASEEHISRAEGDFFNLILDGIRQACAEFMLEVHFRAAQMTAFADVLEETGAQGLIVLRPEYRDIPYLEDLSRSGVRVVTVPGILDGEHIASVSSDNFAGMEQAVAHLVSLGHSAISFVCLTSTVPDHFERLQGFLQSMARHNLQINPRWLYLAHALHADDFSRLCADWLDTKHLPTAIIASDFLMGLAVLRQLNQLGVTVPQDVSLMIFDDPPAAAHIVPALTAIRQQVVRLSYRGVERLVQRILSEDTPLMDRIPTELVVRKSTSHPRH